MSPTRTHSGWRTPAVALASGGLILCIAMGIRHGFGLFLQPMGTDLHWGRETFALAIAVQNLVWGATQPFAGMVSDRFGAAKVVVAGAALYLLGLVAMAHATTPAMLVLGSGVQISFAQPIELVVLALMVATLAAAIGLTLGCSLGQQQIGIMFSLIVGPMIFFGCTYYPWSALASFPILQKLVLLNPFVYASEGFRSALVPQFPHLSGPAVFAGLVGFNALFLWLGLRQFRKKAIG